MALMLMASTNNGASPGSLTLSHILPRSVMLPVDSLSKRDSNRLQEVRKNQKQAGLKLS